MKPNWGILQRFGLQNTAKTCGWFWFILKVDQSVRKMFPTHQRVSSDIREDISRLQTISWMALWQIIDYVFPYPNPLARTRTFPKIKGMR